MSLIGELAVVAAPGDGVATPPAVSPQRSPVVRPGAAALKPWISASMPVGLRRQLRRSFKIAARRLDDRADCRALFADLGADGIEILAATLYYAAAATGGDRWCREGAAAITEVDGRVTRLCPRFGKLPESTAALVLIHEALHQAGLPERPVAADALTASQINRLVAKGCRP